VIANTAIALTALRLPLARLARFPRAWVPVLAWAGLALVAAVALHRRGSSDALELVFGQLVLPLGSFTIVGALLGGDGLARSTRALVAFGAPPAQVAAGTVVAAIGASALLGAILGGSVAALAHGSGDPPLVRDALTSAWVAGLGGAAYAALFSFGASFGKRGIGRSLALVLDWLLGTGRGTFALVTPRAHIRSLLGGDAVLAMSGRASAAMLVGLVIVFASLAVTRARRA